MTTESNLYLSNSPQLHWRDYLETSDSFQGFQWTYFADLSPGPLKQRAGLFLSVVDWDQLRFYTSGKKYGVDCVLLPNIGLGYNHMVRVLEFVDGTRWIARLRMPSLNGSTSDGASITAEFTTISFVVSVTDIPTPFIHAMEPKVHSLVKASFMLMDRLEGNVGMDLGMEVPSDRKASFFNEMAHIHDVIQGLAESFSIANNGPFPLCHGDFGHNNIVVNDQYQAIGVIDWETAFAAPWEVFAEFPLTLSMTPAKMDAPWNYDEHGNPKDEELLHQVLDQGLYVEAVRKAEAAAGIWDEQLISRSLQDSRRQHLITAMRLFNSGKPGWYGKLVDVFWEGEKAK
ncbi:hypothetical protein BJ875DRAFT_515019 [Amylocarpus encephaloides]|uniref:Aminoglycoside phosphotransferase domain-containing protein n=1 Tax=Amylocarpus encephaloides TaxID=45428 RepID=A0A9P8C4Q5_9HELO|nr:hypothetical protein BJ875DRAFT_515019 [Amylocarpus encephaloides]